MIKFNVISIVLLFTLLTTNVAAKIRDFETTRLQSTSGAGVATILVNETSILNPAPIVFIPVSSFYYQKGKSKVDSESDGRSRGFSDGSSQMYLLSDSTTALKGTFSYQDHSEQHSRRRRFTSSLASNSGKKTAFGVLYRYTIDQYSDDEEKKFHQGVLGFTHIYSEQLVIGGILVDPFLSNKEDAKTVIGMQYSLTSNFFLIIDSGANFNDDPEENTLFRGALQVNFLKDLYLRAGQFHDKTTNLKGNSWGISWIGPRLSFEYAYKTSEIISEDADYIFKDEQLIETSVSIAIVF
jgi:hypothetical protein